MSFVVVVVLIVLVVSVNPAAPRILALRLRALVSIGIGQAAEDSVQTAHHRHQRITRDAARRASGAVGEATAEGGAGEGKAAVRRAIRAVAEEVSTSVIVVLVLLTSPGIVVGPWVQGRAVSVVWRGSLVVVERGGGIIRGDLDLSVNGSAWCQSDRAEDSGAQSQ